MPDGDRRVDTREALAIDVAGSIRSARVIEVLAQLVSVHGAPLPALSDNGPEFVSRAILRWLTDAGHRTASQRSGQAVAERHRRELQRQAPRRVPEHGVVSLAARGEAVIETWRRHYNEVRPHSSLDYLTPIEFKARIEQDAASRPATGRIAAVCGASALRPVA